MSLFHSFSRRAQNAPADALADSVMRQARQADFYRNGQSVDTLDGRFFMVALHGGLVHRHLRRHGRVGARAARRMGEILFDRFDHALREEGVGDSSIARRMRGLGEAFYGLARALDTALDADAHIHLDQLIARHAPAGADRAGDLAGYLRAADAALAAQGPDLLHAAEPNWPAVPPAGAGAPPANSGVAFDGDDN